LFDNLTHFSFVVVLLAPVSLLTSLSLLAEQHPYANSTCLFAQQLEVI